VVAGAAGEKINATDLTNDKAMSEINQKTSKHVLEPHERISEVLFGLIMVLTFTGSLSVAEAGRSEIRVMLIGALGCNLAWGIIDGVLYVMGCLAEKGRNLKTLNALRQTKDSKLGRQLLAGALPPLVASILKPEELETMRERLVQLPKPPAYVRASGRDWFGALGVFLLVFLSTFPVAVPFIVMQNAAQAMRVSNGIAVVMLFVTGVAYGRCVGRSPWGFGVTMVVLGLVLVALTVALGG
jgi:VIT1/CCC1 family predicted Fe2+/Mn2+ transporter